MGKTAIPRIALRWTPAGGRKGEDRKSHGCGRQRKRWGRKDGVGGRCKHGQRTDNIGDSLLVAYVHHGDCGSATLFRMFLKLRVFLCESVFRLYEISESTRRIKITSFWNRFLESAESTDSCGHLITLTSLSRVQAAVKSDLRLN